MTLSITSLSKGLKVTQATLNITTLSITILSIRTLSIMALNITIFSKTSLTIEGFYVTLSIKGLHVTLSINDTPHNNVLPLC